jgi:hypothetical protein
VKQHSTVSILDKIYIAILLVVFGGIVLQGPISVGFGTLWPNYSLLIKSWKEILMLIDGVIALSLLYKNRRFKILNNPIIIVIGAYALLHLLLILFIYNGLNSSLAGLAIDLRYVLFFCLVYVAINLYPNYRKMFIKVGIAGALIVLIFALLQVFILPADILKYIGYNVNTISPYLTVDKNLNFIRINSTLRGPNPLGAYAGMVLTLIVAAIAKRKIKKDKWILILVTILSVGGIVTLWASYSRSALIGTILAIFIVLVVAVVPKFSRKIKLISAAVITLIIIISGIFLLNNSQFASNIILHENPNGGSSVNSNEGHISSIETGFGQLIRQPFGTGVGSTGSASLYSKKPVIIENQYLFTAHEAGWLGLVLFIFIFGLIIFDLWKARRDWLVLGVLASGIGLALIGLLLPVWVDDTVSIVWWGLAALVLVPIIKEKKQHERTIK